MMRKRTSTRKPYSVKLNVERLEDRTLLSAGALDPTFGIGGMVNTDIVPSQNNYANDVAIQSDGKIVVLASSGESPLVRYNTDGSLDSTFGSGGIVVNSFGPTFEAVAVAIQEDGGILVGGTIGYSSGLNVSDFALARYDKDGNLDTSFGTGGTVITDFGGRADDLHSIAIQAKDGKIVAAGDAQIHIGPAYGQDSLEFALARYNPDGNLDTTFDADGKVTTDFGTPDSAAGLALGVVIQPVDGKIVATGVSVRGIGGTNDFTLVRYNPDGGLDTSFGTAGKVFTDFDGQGDVADALALQADGKIVVAGRSDNNTSNIYPPDWDFALARYNPDGTLDAGFGSGGKVRTDILGHFDEFADVAVQADGKIVAVGFSGIGGNINNTDSFAVVRYNGDGNLDPSFGLGGVVLTDFGSGQGAFDFATGVAMQVNGNIVVVGGSARTDPAGNLALARYQGDLAVNPATIGGQLQSIVTSLQQTPSLGTSVTYQAASDTQVDAFLIALQNLSTNPNGPVVNVVLDLQGGTYTGKTVNVPPGVTLTIQNGTLVGASPALTIASGQVFLLNDTLTNTTNTPTILVIGGSLMLRHDTIQETTGGSQAAIQIAGGTVDLGTSANPGGNTINVNGPGELIHNAGANAVSAIGNTFEQDGAVLTSPYRIEDAIFHALDVGAGGLVTYVANNVYVTQNSGSIKRGIDAVGAGGTVNVEAGSYAAYNVGSKLLTVAFQNGPILTLRADTLDPAQRTLVASGTAGNDAITFSKNGNAGAIDVTVNALPTATFLPTGRLVAYGLAGGDDIQVAGSISLPTELYGGDGNDRLKGGSGPNILVGGLGDDLVVGGSNRDVLIGGGGADRIVGNAADDILIAGMTTFDANEQALLAIMAEWASSRDYATRVANLEGTGSGPRLNGSTFLQANTTVLDDGSADVLTGSSGQDWFWANYKGAGVLDKITDLSANEFAMDLDFIQAL